MSSFHPLHYTPISSDLLKSVTPYLNTFSTIPNYTHSLRTLLEPSTTHLPPLIDMPCMVTMVPSQPVPWPFATFPYVFSISRAAGKGLLLTHRCFTIPASPISAYLMGNTSSQMQDSPPALPYLFHIVVHNITFLNWVALS